MEMSDLFKSLKQQHQFLEAFLNTIQLQQRAIVENDITGLEETIKTEGALLLNIEQYEKQMVKVINELSEKYSLNTNSNKLTDFIEAMKEKRNFDSGNIIKLQTSLRKLILQIAKINAQNRLLIQQASNYLKDTISTLVGLNKNPIFDRKG
jgi:hypothetical protein